MFENPKHVFWQALVAALIVFAFGIWMGYLLENFRTGQAQILSGKSQIDLMDIKLQSDIYNNREIDCEVAVAENIAFGDRIFEESKILDRGKEANKLTEEIAYQHKAYDILRIMFWSNSIAIKERCKSNYRNVVYFYQYSSPDLDKKAEQGVVSDLLRDLKEKYGSEVMLIPIAADNNVTSARLMMSYYNVTYLPTVLIDEKIKIEGLTTFEKLEEAVIGKISATVKGDIFVSNKSNPFG